MTLSSPANAGFHPQRHARSEAESRRRRPCRGFTLIELLVVIGIILILLGLLLPMLGRAYRNARRARMQSDLHVLAAALEEYRLHFKDYPRTDPNDTYWGGSNYKGHLRGASLLCWALVGPGSASGTAGSDGADGPGFRIRGTTGQVYGPFINVDHFTIGFLNGGMSNAPAGDNHYYFIADTNGYPYLYFPANKAATVTSQRGYVGSTSGGDTPMFDLDDNDIYEPIMGATWPSASAGFFSRGSDTSANTTGDSTATQRFEVMLGDTTPPDGQIESGESPKSTGPYLLWGLGPDDQGGPDTPLNSSGNANASSIANCDDVTNFQ